MLTGLDHIIIGVNNLAEAVDIFQHRLGLMVSGGGTHPTGGTVNRIIVIGDTYLELISIQQPAEAQQSMLDRLDKGEGYLNCVFASDDIELDSLAIAARGITIIGPNAGELKNKDGRSRGWKRTDIEQPDLAQHYPFLIQHDSAGEERRLRLAGWLTPPIHPLGVNSVLSTTLAVENLTEATQRFQHIYALPSSPTYPAKSEGWEEAMLVSFSFSKQSQYFELAASTDKGFLSEKNKVGLPQAGALKTYIQQVGESLCRITLAVENLTKARRYLDQQGVSYLYYQDISSIIWIYPNEACGASIVLRQVD